MGLWPIRGIRERARIISSSLCFFFLLLFFYGKYKYFARVDRWRWEGERERDGEYVRNKYTHNFLWCQCWCLCDTSKAYAMTMIFTRDLWFFFDIEFVFSLFFFYLIFFYFQMHLKPVKARQHTIFPYSDVVCMDSGLNIQNQTDRIKVVACITTKCDRWWRRWFST